MFTLRETETFASWLDGLPLPQAARVYARLKNMAAGNLSDCKAVGSGILETRIHSGPGLRVYFIRRRNEVILLLAGGNKSTQGRDIERARILAREYRGDGKGEENG